MTAPVRLLLCLLLCLALPLNGLAALAVQAGPCPMAAQHEGMAMDSAEDCCAAQMGERSGGKLCKSGQQCQGGSLLQVTIGKPLLRLAGTPLLARYGDFIPSPTPEGLWRPPRA
ncbi:hypothetical protein SBP02_08750 [Pseudomonas benzenivorans]|uniref:Uncharacterized protein n=1 Tax=Pseudomonas benzenivorans TaxID=556533 RepID=A0ABZ0Q049_9PSED|nr:hypothetical protein [Pseudomonas benzenivorans]WPC06818.1 hypothetical protein SBP02_08750 [Pseudomonas benzenivorans]